MATSDPTQYNPTIDHVSAGAIHAKVRRVPFRSREMVFHGTRSSPDVTCFPSRDSPSAAMEGIQRARHRGGPGRDPKRSRGRGGRGRDARERRETQEVRPDWPTRLDQRRALWRLPMDRVPRRGATVLLLALQGPRWRRWGRSARATRACPKRSASALGGRRSSSCNCSFNRM